MSKGRERNWDTLRAHLANAKIHTDVIDKVLIERAELVRRNVQASSNATTDDVAQLASAQSLFILVMLLVVLVTLWTLRARGTDQAELYKRAYFDPLTNLPNLHFFRKTGVPINQI